MNITKKVVRTRLQAIRFAAGLFLAGAIAGPQTPARAQPTQAATLLQLAPLGSLVSLETSTDRSEWTLVQQMTATNQNWRVSYPLETQPVARFFRLSMP